MPKLFCDLARDRFNGERGAIFVAEFLVWWFQVGHFLYDDDEGLRVFAEESVKALGGWRAARATLRSSEHAQVA